MASPSDRATAAEPVVSALWDGIPDAVRAVHWREAEAFVGRRLDRRRSYAIGPNLDDRCTILLVAIEWVDSCSGCFEGGEYGGLAHYYPWDAKRQCHVGAGCSECGYKGVRRNSMWVPAQGMSAFGQDPQGLEAKPASPVRQDAPPTSSDQGTPNHD